MKVEISAVPVVLKDRTSGHFRGVSGLNLAQLVVSGAKELLGKRGHIPRIIATERGVDR